MPAAPETCVLLHGAKRWNSLCHVPRTASISRLSAIWSAARASRHGWFDSKGGSNPPQPPTAAAAWRMGRILPTGSSVRWAAGSPCPPFDLRRTLSGGSGIRRRGPGISAGCAPTALHGNVQGFFMLFSAACPGRLFCTQGDAAKSHLPQKALPRNTPAGQKDPPPLFPGRRAQRCRKGTGGVPT